MLDNNLIQSTSSWPFVEIRKLLKDRKDRKWLSYTTEKPTNTKRVLS